MSVYALTDAYACTHSGYAHALTAIDSGRFR